MDCQEICEQLHEFVYATLEASGWRSGCGPIDNAGAKERCEDASHVVVMADVLQRSIGASVVELGLYFQTGFGVGLLAELG